MSGNAWISILLVALALVLPISALLQRRLALSKVAGMALIWIGIFLVCTLVISFVL